MTALAAMLPGCSRSGGQAAPVLSVADRSTSFQPPARPATRSNPDPLPPGGLIRRFVHAGTTVEMALLPGGASPDRPAASLRAGDDVTFRFRIFDAATGQPITGAKPAAWLAPRAEGEPRTPGQSPARSPPWPRATHSIPPSWT